MLPRSYSDSRKEALPSEKHVPGGGAKKVMAPLTIGMNGANIIKGGNWNDLHGWLSGRRSSLFDFNVSSFYGEG
jgi:hypothetical protein